jgi:ADP-ribosylglycohydrolase
MLGAIVGDVCGSAYEWDNLKTDRLSEIDLCQPACRFTDDTAMTVAVAEACLGDGDYVSAFKKWGRRYPDAGYGGRFHHWLFSESCEPYNSYGNGSAMRVSPISWLFNSLEKTLAEAKRSAEVTHNHPEGIKGAQATAAAIFWARTGHSRDAIREGISREFHYPLNNSTEHSRPGYTFDVSCQGSVPEAITCFLESTDFTHALRLAISLGGDSDTIACMTGGIAEAFYQTVPENLASFAKARLSPEMLETLEHFESRRIAPANAGKAGG